MAFGGSPLGDYGSSVMRFDQRFLLMTFVTNSLKVAFVVIVVCDLVIDFCCNDCADSDQSELTPMSVSV